MNSLNKLFFIIFCAFCCHLQAVETRPCYIQDHVKHQKNKELLAAIIKEELYNLNLNSYEKSRYLSNRIRQIAQKCIDRGLSIEAYQVPEIDFEKAASFKSFVLWEGAEQTIDSVPLTFFIYIWPSEKNILQYHGLHYRSHKSNIHSHPISCALSVLSGSLTQRRFCCVNPQSRTVQILQTDIFNVGEGDVDDLKEPFIHQLYNSSDEPMSISLHAYGLSSEEEVRDCFEETFSECSFFQ